MSTSSVLYECSFRLQVFGSWQEWLGDEAVAIVAVYLGETDEDKINSMSIVFFNNVLGILGKKVNYDAVVNYAGNSFAKDAWKTIQEANPLIKHKKKHAFADMFAEVAIKQSASVEAALPGKSWFNLGSTETGDITNTATE